MLSSKCLCRAGRSISHRSTASRCRAPQPAFRHRLPRRVVAASAPADPPAPAADEEEEEFEGLLPEEDVEVPGSLQEALNPNTKLGKAVKAAVQELEHLNKLEAEVMEEYNAKLRQLGINIDIFAAPPAPATDDERERGAAPRPDGTSADGPAAAGGSEPGAAS